MNPISILIPHLSDMEQGTIYLSDFERSKKILDDSMSQTDIISNKIDDLDSLFFMLCYLLKG